MHQKVRLHLQVAQLRDGETCRVVARGTVQPLRFLEHPTQGRVQLIDIHLTYPGGTLAETWVLSVCAAAPRSFCY